MGETNDWIELYNRGTSAVNLTGYYLTDNDWNLTKWEIPAGTILEPDQYLIIWADEDSAQGPMHANFKLSANGERVMLINGSAQIADDVTFGEQFEDQGFARRPNGYGDFEIQGPTFSYNNDLVNVEEIETTATLGIYPNPFNSNGFSLTTDGLNSGTYTLKLYDLSGRVCHQETVSVTTNTILNINPDDLASGTYMISLETEKAGIRSLIVKN
jgi:Lamin Tail Domain/Secretion system C-terminal sorting domain